jgi:hypothetical protein
MSETDLIPEPWGAFLRELDRIATEPWISTVSVASSSPRNTGFQGRNLPQEVLLRNPSDFPKISTPSAFS